MVWTILVEDHQRNISAKLYGNRSNGFWQEDFLSFVYSYIGKISSAPWRPCFLTNPNGLNNLDGGSPKEHFCKMILKSVQWFLIRRVLSFLYRYIGRISPVPRRPFFFFFFFFFWRIQIAWTILVQDNQRNISAELYGNRSNGFRQEDF